MVFAVLFWALAQLIDNFTVSLLLLVLIWLYYALMGLKVVDKRGRRLTFGKATKRLLSRLITNFTFYFGFFSAAFDKQNKTLHDRLSKSLVVEKDVPFDPKHYSEEDEPVLTMVTVVSVLLALVFVLLLVWLVVLPQYQNFDAKIKAAPRTEITK